MEVRIGLVAPYEGMMAIANELAKRRGVALLARTALLEDAAEAARDMESQGVDVVIVREGTEVCLRGALKIPIVPIRMSGMDILRAVLKAREISKKGRSIIPIDVRIIAATNAPLLDMVSRGAFREDLYYRLAVLRLHLPSLGERKEDIPVIARHILSQYGVDKKNVEAVLSALDHFKEYPWRGNVRELVNILAQLVALLPQAKAIKTSEVTTILHRLLHEPSPMMYKVEEKNEREILDETDQIRNLAAVFKNIEKRVVRELLREKGMTKTQIARLLGISRTTLWRRRKKWQSLGDDTSFEGPSSF